MPIAIVLLAASAGLFRPVASGPAQAVADGRARCSTGRPNLIITWIDPEGAVPDTAHISAEVLSLLSSVGVDSFWRPYRDPKPPDEGAELHVHLRMSDPRRLGIEPRTMGVVYGGDEPDRRVFVYFQTVARVLGLDPRSARAEMKVRSRLDVSRALGRVIVHEVFHAIAPGAPHGAEGLTRETLARKDLIGERPKFDPAAVELLIDALRSLQKDRRSCAVDTGPVEKRRDSN